jgi:hypothetical protein
MPTSRQTARNLVVHITDRYGIHTVGCPGCNPEPESFYAIRRVGGEKICGLEWMTVGGPDDWTLAEEGLSGEPIEWEIVKLTVTPVARRTFGQPDEDEEE